MGCGASTETNPSKAYVSQPEQLPQYVRKELIGKGTYGQVFKCINTTSNKEYAMKVIKVNQKTKEEAARHIHQLKMEISMLKKLNHPNTVKYESFDVTPDLEEVEIVMELVESGTLKEYIDKNGPLTEMLTAKICFQILESLIYLHAQNIIHRDIKCANVMLTKEMVPKLTDFGTAKIIPTESKDDIAKLCASLKGTPFFMAPEVLKRTGHNHSADIWSFGCMVIEMLSGKIPWSNHSAKFSQIIGYISSGIHPPFPPNLTKECSFFIESCLDPVPSHRLSALQLQKHRFIDRNTKGSVKGPLSRNNKNQIVPQSNRFQPEKYKPQENRNESRIDRKKESRNKIYDTSDKKNDRKYESNEKSRKTIYEMAANPDDGYEGLNRKNTEDSYSRFQVNEVDYEEESRAGTVKTGKKSNRRTSEKKPVKRHTSKIVDQLNQLDKLESEINQVSIEEEDFTKDKYYIKKTLANLKKKNTKHISKTSTTVKNTEDNILSMDNSVAEFPLRSNTEMSHEEAHIDTAISRAERDRYLEIKKVFQLQREEEKKKWEEELKEGAQMLKKEFSSRYDFTNV